MTTDPKRIHFVGIKGVAMAALALYWKERGALVTGSDTDETFPTDGELHRAGIQVVSGFSEGHIATFKPDLVIYTGAHEGRDNVEVRAALATKISVLPHGKALGEVMTGKRQISVAGSHGKTTTSAMLVTILSTAGIKPSYAIGCGEIFGLGSAGHFDTGDVFVAEADEYVTDPHHDQTPRFLWQHPDILVVTNIDYDHPDAYASLSAVEDAFMALQAQQQGDQITIINADDKPSQRLANGKRVVTFGLSDMADVQISSIVARVGMTEFSLESEGVSYRIILHVPGTHNVLNAAAAASACSELGVDWDVIIQGLSRFQGTKRRFEKLSDTHGVLFYDDYAHHPKEIQATLEAARLWYPKRRIIVLFQPHTYSRTKALLSDFAQSFAVSDAVILTDIYASAREKETLGIDVMTLVSETKKYHTDVTYAKDAVAVATHLKGMIQKDDVVICMGAGDIYTWEKDIIKAI